MYHKIQVVIDFSVDTRTWSASYTKDLVVGLVRSKLDQLAKADLKDFNIEMSVNVASTIDKGAQ